MAQVLLYVIERFCVFALKFFCVANMNFSKIYIFYNDGKQIKSKFLSCSYGSAVFYQFKQLYIIFLNIKCDYKSVPPPELISYEI